MAEKEVRKPKEEEMKIPVFTVIKNGAILKNIFVIQSQLSTSNLQSISSTKDEENPDQENEEEILMVGRHPDCHIMLTHPSISRFHLQIHSNRSSQKMSVIDLSSVHGTWVSGKKIEPRVPMELNEGDTIRVGSSTRVYRLHWVPFSRAYDMDNPFVSPLDVPMLEEGNEVETHQDEISVSPPRKAIRSVDLTLRAPVGEALSEITDNEESQIIRPLFVIADSFELENSESTPIRSDKSPTLDSIWSRRGKPASILQIQAGSSRGKIIGYHNNAEVELKMQEDIENKSISKTLFSGSEETDEEHFTPDKENVSPDTRLLKSCKRKDKLEEVMYSRSCRTSSSKVIGDHSNTEIEVQKQEDIENKSISKSLFSGSEETNEENFTPDKENVSPDTRLLKSCIRKDKLEEVMDSRSCRASSSKVIGDHSNTVEVQKQEDIENKSISKSLFSGSEETDEENFTPDKENVSPNTHLLKSFKEKGKLEEVKNSRSCKTSSSKVTFSPSIQLEEDFGVLSGKMNLTPKVLREQKLTRNSSRKQGKMEQNMPLEKGVERVLFQSLPVNSADRSRSDAAIPTTTTTRSRNSEKRVTDSSSVREGRRNWTMVVDTATLLDKEARRSLQLLQGLRGTQLIIPQTVMRELDCLKRRGGWFRRTTEASSVLEWIEECMVKRNWFRRTTEASLVLEWIEECMVKSKWWIQMQSSVEEGRLIAPTPPASPQPDLSEGFHTSLTEIGTPTAEDNILDYALRLRKMKSDGQLVLLSNDVTLKIKAMAEGLLCETAQEFRGSLVNPFSERFLWADSSPRGLTWSCLDDVVLREKYSRRCPVQKSSKGGEGGAKGLKLILLHNSHYKKLSSVR